MKSNAQKSVLGHQGQYNGGLLAYTHIATSFKATYHAKTGVQNDFTLKDCLCEIKG